VPEIPDLLYINEYLLNSVAGRRVSGVEVGQPVVLRLAVDASVDGLLSGRRIVATSVRGPFLKVEIEEDLEILMNLMLAGRLQHQRPGERPEGFRCFSLLLDDDSALHLCDQKRMAKVYVVRAGQTTHIPKYDDQGIDVRSADLTPARFRELVTANRRRQVRVFLTDQRVLSSIGNAYADEILFEARIHPKTFLGKLSAEEQGTLYHAIKTVFDWGIREVRSAGRPIHVKVREHMKVRNRKGEPCPRCGQTIRREGVRGYDVFFCPACQPATRRLFLDWRNQH